MTLAGISSGESVFVDTNILVYYFSSDPLYGPACQQFLTRVVSQDPVAHTLTHLLTELAHQLMIQEAATQFTWSSRVADRLRKHPQQIQKLTKYRGALAAIPTLGIQVLTIPPDLPRLATSLSHQYSLLSNDALILALMQHHGLTHLASNDADFDRVPGITRYAAA